MSSLRKGDPYPSILAAKKAISNYLGLPMGKLEPDHLAKINAIVSKTLTKNEVIENIRTQLKPVIKESWGKPNRNRDRDRNGFMKSVPSLTESTGQHETNGFVPVSP
jgi:hypothetical protein